MNSDTEDRKEGGSPSPQRLGSDDLHFLVTTAKNLCPQWMNPLHHAHYMNVRRELIAAFERGRRNQNTSRQVRSND